MIVRWHTHLQLWMSILQWVLKNDDVCLWHAGCAGFCCLQVLESVFRVLSWKKGSYKLLHFLLVEVGLHANMHPMRGRVGIRKEREVDAGGKERGVKEERAEDRWRQGSKRVEGRWTKREVNWDDDSHLHRIISSQFLAYCSPNQPFNVHASHEWSIHM